VEGLPDRDFYYLIGVRIGSGESAVQHSLWADTIEDEERIWREFLGVLETVEKPILIHYGSYETDFLRRLSNRYDRSTQSTPDRAAVNILNEMFAHVYFPTYSNTLKDIGVWLGVVWSDSLPVGVLSIEYRFQWERSRDMLRKSRLVEYNTQDCRGVEMVTRL
jgi:predicted RecB family nuclease